MFDKKEFDKVLLENGLSVADVAQALGISKTTLYRKINGESDFFRSEIQQMRKLFHLENVDNIFFAE